MTGSLLFYAPVCCFAVCGAAELSLSVLFGGTAYIWLAGWELFFRQVCVSSVMAADSVAVAGGWAGITFGVELDAAMCRILQGRDVRSVCALVPDSRSLERYGVVAAGSRYNACRGQEAFPEYLSGEVFIL